MLNNFITQYIASEGMVWDYKEPHFDPEGKEEHLYLKIIYIGEHDSIDNYIEVEEPER